MPHWHHAWHRSNGVQLFLRNGDFFRQCLFGYDQTDGYKVLRAGQLVGAIIVWILPDGHNVLGTIFVDPDAQDQGVGTRIWQFIEARYPETKSWRLTTPRWATKNHHFYAVKCHFARVESDPTVGSSCYQRRPKNR